MKPKVVISISVLMLVLFGISMHKKSITVFPTEFYMKTDPLNNSGKLSACDGEKIYYFSQEQGNPGIYSMSPDGTDIKFIVECKKVGKIQCKDNWLYYTEYTGEGKYGRKKNVAIPQYELVRLNLDNKKKEKIDIYPKGANYTLFQNANSVFRSILDFYVFSDNKILVMNTDFTFPTNQYGYSTYIVDTEKNELIKKSQIQKIGKISDSDYFYLFKFGNEILLSENLQRLKGEDLEKNETEEWFSSIEEETTIYNINTGELFNHPENRYVNSDRFPRIQLVLGSRVFVSDEERLRVVNRDTLSVEQVIKLPARSYIKWSKEYNNQIWLGVGKLSPTRASYSSQRYGEKIYYINLDDYILHEVSDFGKNEVVYFDGERIVTAGRKKINQYRLNENCNLEKEWKIELNRLGLENVRIEVSGNWLFVNQFDRKTGVDKLLYKIDLDKAESFEVSR